MMELGEGETLAAKLHKGKLSIDNTLLYRRVEKFGV